MIHRMRWTMNRSSLLSFLTKKDKRDVDTFLLLNVIGKDGMIVKDGHAITVLHLPWNGRESIETEWNKITKHLSTVKRDDKHVFERGLKGKHLGERFNKIMKSTNQYMSHTTMSSTDDEPADDDFVHAVEKVMRLRKEGRQKKEEEKQKKEESDENQEKKFQVEQLRIAGVQRLENKMRKAGSNSSDKGEDDDTSPATANKYKTSTNNKKTALISNNTSTGIEFRKEKMIVDEQRYIREMEDRKEERKSRAEDRQLMMMMMQKQNEMMQLLVKKFDDSKDK